MRCECSKSHTTLLMPNHASRQKFSTHHASWKTQHEYTEIKQYYLAGYSGDV